MPATEAVLYKIRTACELCMPDCILDGRVDVEHMPEYQALCLQMSGFVWGEELEAEIVSYPSSWWDALKDRWFPNWLERRFPVRMTTKRVQFKVLYPDFKPALPKERFTIKAFTSGVDAEEGDE